MNDQPSEPASADYRRLAAEMLARRRLRGQFFERQSFSEQRWDLMLVLFTNPASNSSVEQVSVALGMTAATTLALARILAGFDLVGMGDSDGGWSDIPLRLTDNGRERMQAYFAELLAQGMMA